MNDNVKKLRNKMKKQIDVDKLFEDAKRVYEQNNSKSIKNTFRDNTFMKSQSSQPNFDQGYRPGNSESLFTTLTRMRIESSQFAFDRPKKYMPPRRRTKMKAKSSQPKKDDWKNLTFMASYSSQGFDNY